MSECQRQTHDTFESIRDQLGEDVLFNLDKIQNSNCRDAAIDSIHEDYKEILKLLQEEYFKSKYHFSPSESSNVLCVKISEKEITNVDCGFTHRLMMSATHKKVSFENILEEAEKTINAKCFNDLRFFYLRKPPRSRREIICFESPFMVLGMMSEFGYSDTVGHDVTQRSKWYSMLYQDEYREQNKHKASDSQNPEKYYYSKTFRQGDISLVPENFTETKFKIATRRKDESVEEIEDILHPGRLTRLPPEAFFLSDFYQFAEYIPDSNLAKRMFPYLAFMLHLKANSGKLSQNRKIEINTLDQATHFFDLNNFYYDDWDFFCFISQAFLKLKTDARENADWGGSTNSEFWSRLYRENENLFQIALDIARSFDPYLTFNYLMYEISEKEYSYIQDYIFDTVFKPFFNGYGLCHKCHELCQKAKAKMQDLKKKRGRSSFYYLNEDNCGNEYDLFSGGTIFDGYDDQNF